MEKSGFKGAVETVYARVTNGHMMIRKAYTRGVRSHMMLESAALLLLEEFWHSLTTVEQAQLVKIYDLPNPEECKD